MFINRRTPLKPSTSNRTTSEVHKKVRNILLIEGFVNLLVLIAKVTVGVTTGSSAILGDALHSLADVANNIVALIISKLSTSPPDSDHPYGHRKFETLAVFILATLLSVMAVEISLRAIDRAGETVQHTAWGLGVMIGVLLLYICLASWENYWSCRLNSNLLRADAHHTFSDVFTTVAVILGWQLAVHGHPIFDTIFALLVSVLVFYLAFDLFRRAVPILVDKAAVAPELLEETILRVPGVKEVRQVRSRFAESEIIADVIVSVNPKLSTEKSHRIADAVETILTEKLDINDVTVHIESKEPAAANISRRR